MTMPVYPTDVLERAKNIKLIGFDVDGTLTDGRLLYGTDGHEAKCFHVLDGLGFTLLRHAGIQLALVTARISEVVERRGRDPLHAGELAALVGVDVLHLQFAAGMGIGMDQVAFVGDDLPDLATMRNVGLAIAPANAHHWVLPVAHWVTPRRGGEGAGRDACDLLLHAQDHVEGILAHGEHP